MAIRGPKPKPSAIKLMAGNPGKRPLNPNEPAPEPGDPGCPEHLNDHARETWTWLCHMLDGFGILAKSDIAIMTLYCDTWAEYVKIRKDVNTFGFIMVSDKTGNPFVNPQLNIEAMFKKQLTQYLSELGLSATARTRLHGRPTGDGSGDVGKERFFKTVG